MVKTLEFTTEMFDAVVKGLKTQTRRIMDFKTHTGEHYIVDRRRLENASECGLFMFSCNCDECRRNNSHMAIIKGKYEVGDKVMAYDSEGVWEPFCVIEITKVRAEKVQDIIEEDAIAEGVNGGCIECGELQPCGCSNPSPDYIDSFIWIWNAIHGKDAWEQNPWIWVYEFKRLEK